MKRGVQALVASAVGAAVAVVGSSSLLAACGSSGNLDVGAPDGASDATSALGDGSADGGAIGTACADAGTPATTLECTGLYADFATKQIAPTAQPYAPATPLWADGAEKGRWIELPAGTTIDITNPNEWTFPIGTKAWKEFRVNGQRVETRMFQKLSKTYWVHATYKWNADDSSAAISYGETVSVGTDGGTWSIPTPDACDECHRGRTDRLLGFEQVGLGLAGATGLTLAQLASQGLVSPVPSNVHLTIGDDGSGKDAPALAWLHVNCGVTCHNGNEGSSAFGAGMLLRLDPTVLDGGPAAGWDPQRTTINVATISAALNGAPRIIPGDSADSVIVQLISARGAGTIQMPPIASTLVDTTDVAAVAAWIDAIPNDAGVDGGIHDGGFGHDGGHHKDAGDDAGNDAGDDAGDDAGNDAGEDADNDASGDAGTDATLQDASDAATDEDGGAPDSSMADAATNDAAGD